MSIQKKKQLAKEKITKEHNCSGACVICTKKHMVIDKMAEANIPVGYWFLNMKGFTGSEKLKELVNNYIEQIDDNFASGKSVCLSGSLGTGKTMSSTCILKAALKKDYSAYYTTASDLLSDYLDREKKTKEIAKSVDFLVIDELDSRFFISDSAKELFSSTYENVFRHRVHNAMPTIICTNETEGILNVFYGAGKHAIDSLNNQYLKIYPVVGLDFRRNS